MEFIDSWTNQPKEGGYNESCDYQDDDFNEVKRYKMKIKFHDQMHNPIGPITSPHANKAQEDLNPFLIKHKEVEPNQEFLKLYNYINWAKIKIGDE
jgi:hypothetical protein